MTGGINGAASSVNGGEAYLRRLQNVRAMRIATIIRYVPGIYKLFKEAIRAAMDEVDEPTRETAERLLRDVLAGTPAGITALLYIDRRIRREALDIELARAAGVPGA